MEKVQFRICGVSMAWGQVNRLGVGGNYLCFLVIIAIFMVLGGTEIGILKSSYGGSSAIS